MGRFYASICSIGIQNRKKTFNAMHLLVLFSLLWLSFAKAAPLRGDLLRTLTDTCRIGKDTLTGRRLYLEGEIGPECEGGTAAWLRHLNKTLDIRKLPTDEIRTSYIIAFIVEKDGTIRGERSVDGPPNDITKQLFAAARTIRWIPGKCHGKNVPMLLKLPVFIEYQIQ